MPPAAPPPKRVAVPAKAPTFTSTKPAGGTAPVFGSARTGIREQGYRHWEGTYTGHTWRWWTITKATLRSTVYTKGRLFMLLILIGAAWIFPFFFGVFYFFGQVGQGLTTSPNELLRRNLSEMTINWTWMWAIVFSAVVGSRLVSNDLRSEAFYIYLSKPIRRTDYFVGKVLALVIWMVPVTLAPSLWVYSAANGASNKLLKITEAGEIFWELMAVQTLLLFLCSTVAVAVSSMTKRWALSLIGWMGGAFILLPIAEITSAATRNPDWLYISPVNNIWLLTDHFYEQELNAQFFPAWEGALWITIGLIVAALGVFLTRVWKLEAAE